MKIIRFISSGFKAALLVFAVITGMALTQRAEAQCAQVNIDTLFAGAGKTKCGYSENTTCGSYNPNNRYLKSTAISTAYVVYSAYTQGSYFETENGFYETTSISTYDPANNCAFITTCTGSAQANKIVIYDGDPGDTSSDFNYSGTLSSDCNTWSDGGSAIATVNSWIGSVSPTSTPCTATTSGIDSSGSSSGSSDYGYYNDSYDENNTTTLGSLYTDAMLRSYLLAAIPSYPSTWAANANSSAYYTLTSDHLTAAGGRMKYRFHLTAYTVNFSYRVTWDQVTTYPNNSPAPSVQHMQEEIQGNGDPVNGTYGSVHEVDVPGTPSTITEANVNVTLSSGDNPGG
jgi:hypothetical protein